MDIELNYQQAETLKKLKHWWLHERKNKQTYEISGRAGTGKSTLIYHLIKELGLSMQSVLFVTFTGRASLNLTRKKCFAKTIHSTIYEMVLVPLLDDKGNPILNKKGKPSYTMSFVKRPYLDPNVRLIVVDEASTVDTQLAKDLLQHDINIIALGDLDQIGPVNGSPYFLSNPDSFLLEIMRQKKDDPILILSHKAINGEILRLGQYGEFCKVIKKSDLNDDIIREATAVICGRNYTRARINKYIRETIHKFKPGVLYVEDTIICRKNNWTVGCGEIFLVNGLVGKVRNIHHHTMDTKSKTIEIDFSPDFDDTIIFEDVEIDLDHLYNETNKSKKRYDNVNLFEWGYCITGHLAQGSQYDNVLVYDERMGTQEDHRKWLYTSITRAERKLTVAI